MTAFVKVVFPLIIDEDGFPPVSSETLNARRERGNGLVLENTPFFVNGIALGDRIAGTPIPGQSRRYSFERVLLPSANKAISIIFLDIGIKEPIYQELKQRGCYCEYGEFGKLQMLAIGVLPDCDYPAIVRYLVEFENANLLSYAELAV